MVYDRMEKSMYSSMNDKRVRRLSEQGTCEDSSENMKATERETDVENISNHPNSHNIQQNAPEITNTFDERIARLEAALENSDALNVEKDQCIDALQDALYSRNCLIAQLEEKLLEKSEKIGHLEIDLHAKQSQCACIAAENEDLINDMQELIQELEDVNNQLSCANTRIDTLEKEIKEVISAKFALLEMLENNDTKPSSSSAFEEEIQNLRSSYERRIKGINLEKINLEQHIASLTANISKNEEQLEALATGRKRYKLQAEALAKKMRRTFSRMEIQEELGKVDSMLMPSRKKQQQEESTMGRMRRRASMATFSIMGEALRRDSDADTQLTTYVPFQSSSPTTALPFSKEGMFLNSSNRLDPLEEGSKRSSARRGSLLNISIGVSGYKPEATNEKYKPIKIDERKSTVAYASNDTLSHFPVSQESTQNHGRRVSFSSIASCGTKASDSSVQLISKASKGCSNCGEINRNHSEESHDGEVPDSRMSWVLRDAVDMLAFPLGKIESSPYVDEDFLALGEATVEIITRSTDEILHQSSLKSEDKNCKDFGDSDHLMSNYLSVDITSESAHSALAAVLPDILGRPPQVNENCNHSRDLTTTNARKAAPSIEIVNCNQSNRSHKSFFQTPSTADELAPCPLNRRSDSLKEPRVVQNRGSEAFSAIRGLERPNDKNIFGNAMAKICSSKKSKFQQETQRNTITEIDGHQKATKKNNKHLGGVARAPVSLFSKKALSPEKDGKCKRSCEGVDDYSSDRLSLTGPTQSNNNNATSSECPYSEKSQSVLQRPTDLDDNDEDSIEPAILVPKVDIELYEGWCSGRRGWFSEEKEKSVLKPNADVELYEGW